jgi:hypothetical protein
LAEVCKRTGELLWVDPGPVLRWVQQVTRDDGVPVVSLATAVPATDLPHSLEIHRDGIAFTASHIFIVESLLQECAERLKDDNDAIRRVSTLPIDRTFVYLDVSDFSKEKAGVQNIIINSIIHMVDDEQPWSSGFPSYGKNGLETSICIGDGYIFVHRTPETAVYFAAWLCYLIDNLRARKRLPGSFHYRTGVHVGPVYCFWDIPRKAWNYIGDGINGGQRILAAIGKDTDDVMFLSDAVRSSLLALSDNRPYIVRILSALHNRGRRADKHGNPWRVYELNHTDLISTDNAIQFTSPCTFRDSVYLSG